MSGMVGSMSKRKCCRIGPKMARGVNCQREQDHVLVKDKVANNCVTNGGDTCC